MKKLIIELMNHGYSQEQAQMFIQECCNTFMDLAFDSENRKEFEAKYAASDNETVGN